MKKIFFPIAALLFMTSCNDASSPKNETKSETKASTPQFFGERITEEGALPTDSLKSMMSDKTELVCKLQGTIQAVCQTKGCWMELKNADGTSLRITFKDYGFFMPKDASGKTAIVDGIAKVEVTSVADLKEYAKDDKKTKEEIEAIKEPVSELVFEAKGVIIK